MAEVKFEWFGSGGWEFKVIWVGHNRCFSPLALTGARSFLIILASNEDGGIGSEH